MHPQSPRFPGSLPGSNAGRGRVWNRGLVLRHVRAAGPCGRAEIARASGLTTQAVSNIIAELEAEGLLVEAGLRSAGRGMPVIQYAVSAEGGHALGFEVRPDAIRAVLADLSGKAVWSGRRALDQAGPEAVLSEIAALKDEAEAMVRAVRLCGVGVVTPGPFGPTGLRGPATELPGWDRIAPGPWLEERLGLPVTVENDANAAAVAERLSGVARGLDDFAFLYFGTGLGLGLVSGGVLVRGAQGNAGEIGHVPIGGRRLEEVASRLALADALSAAGVPAHTVEEIAEAAGHPACGAWLEEAAAALSVAVPIIENLFDPQVVILGGALPDELIARLIERIALPEASLAHRPDRAMPRLMRGASGRLTATHGAAALALDRLFTPRLEVS